MNQKAASPAPRVHVFVLVALRQVVLGITKGFVMLLYRVNWATERAYSTICSRDAQLGNE